MTKLFTHALRCAYVFRRLSAVLLSFALVSPGPTALVAAATHMPTVTAPAAAPTSGQAAASLESAASKASSVGRKVAMSLVALGFAIAAVVLIFRRDFKEAVGVFAVGLLAILLATPSGVNVLHDTINTLFGSS
jgi:hypothetical protein